MFLSKEIKIKLCCCLLFYLFIFYLDCLTLIGFLTAFISVFSGFPSFTFCGCQLLCLLLISLLVYLSAALFSSFHLISPLSLFFSFLYSQSYIFIDFFLSCHYLILFTFHIILNYFSFFLPTSLSLYTSTHEHKLTLTQPWRLRMRNGVPCRGTYI